MTDLTEAPTSVAPNTDTDYPELIQRSQNGDEAAFETIVRRNARSVYSAAYRTLRNVDDANDVMQDAFVKAYEALGSVRTGERFSAWIARIAIRKACALARAERRRRLVENSAICAPESGGSRACEDADEWAAELKQRIASLPTTYRTAIVLRYVEGSSLAEIADALLISPDAAEKRIERGIRRLSVYLRRSGMYRAPAPARRGARGKDGRAAPRGVSNQSSGSATRRPS